MNIIKKPYEISLWEDVLIFVMEDGSKYEGSIPEGATGLVVSQYYKERKICVIGSNTMNTPIRAVNPKLNLKVNGSVDFTFRLYSQYYDEDSEEFIANPFAKLLANERKIKVRYGALGANDTKWYDLVIKNIQENSEEKTYDYTAKSLFVNELSKSGFDLVFDSELENNMGNISYLGEKVLEGSDWRLEDSGDILEQYKEEPLYKITLNQDIVATDMKNDKMTISLRAGTEVYGFYSTIANKDPYFQFLYAETYEVDDDFVITNAPKDSNWYIKNMKYTEDGLPLISAIGMVISEEYRGKKLVRKLSSKYDATIDKYVQVYKDGEDEVYGYTETEYTSSAMVRSYITNGDMSNQEVGWEVGGSDSENGTIFPSINFVSVPDIRDIQLEDFASQQFQHCLKIDNINNNWALYNSGLVDYRHYIDNFALNEEYICRLKCGKVAESGQYGAKTLYPVGDGIQFVVGVYELHNGVYEITEEIFAGTFEAPNEDGYVTVASKCLKALSYSDLVEMSKSLGFFLKFPDADSYYLEEAQFFKKIEKEDKTILLPNELLQSEIKTVYYYYKPNTSYKSIDEVEFVYKGYEPSAAYEEVYNDKTFEKIRSIKAEESNRFNLIQELCEIFECWPKFRIEHNPMTGEILMDENHQQKKFVSFWKYIGKENDRGFKYGINLKAIKRTIESDSLVSKLIVKNNENEFAKDGFCTIARAQDNPNGENFILNFSYYIQQGMLKLSQITNDLYSEINGSIGYYKKLRTLNDKRDSYIIEQSGLLANIAEYQASFQTYEISVIEATELEKDSLALLKSLTGLSFEELIANKENAWWENEEVLKTATAIGRYRAIIDKHTELRNQAKENLDTANQRYELLGRILSSRTSSEDEERLLLEKEHLHKIFYKKYSRFLQEGSWISEDYIDDNLYYLDAEGVSHTSAHPKISYDINVLEISQLEGYENYTFDLGDKSFIEDTEFFGWTIKNGLKTPYREEIIVSEIELLLDEPDKNVIKVQNYKTQFEDLFQRIEATSQSLEYHSGEYSKASSVVESNGTIKTDTLQNSIANNALTIQNAKDQTVVWDETGITATSATSPAEIVRIVNGGIFLSRDGGNTWSTGITGRGINASCLSSGQINTEEILIMSGGFPSFRWDSSGISAYKFNTNPQTGALEGFNQGKFIRMDQYGLYGIDGLSNFNASSPDEDGAIGEEKIWKNSNFALTWKGFQIKSRHEEGGFISITSNDDLQVIDGNNQERIKIGQIGSSENGVIYGISIKDLWGNSILETGEEGTLWLRNKLDIGTSKNDTSVSIGYLQSEDEIHGSEVFNASSNFIVYEDGHILAESGYFHGEINATGGSIGGLTIEQWEQASYEVHIESSNGLVFKETPESSEEEILTTLTATLYHGVAPIESQKLKYFWYNLQKPGISLGENKTLEVTRGMLSEGDLTQITCQITRSDNNG